MGAVICMLGRMRNYNQHMGIMMIYQSAKKKTELYKGIPGKNREKR